MHVAFFGITATTVISATLLAAPTAQAGSLVSSAAYGLGASFTSAGVQTSLQPLAEVGGSAPPAFSKRGVLDVFNDQVPIGPSQGTTPTLFATGGNVATHASGTGIAIDTVSAEGDAADGTVNLVLMLNPPPPRATVEPQPFLSVTSSGVSTTASLSKVFPHANSVSASSAIASLSITGSLLGGRTISFSGSPAANTVIYKGPTLTITLNQQLIIQVVTCSPDCVIEPVGITAKAIDIELHDADLDGQTVSGDIVVAGAKAD